MSRLRLLALGEEFSDSLVHFPRGLIREGHTQNVSRHHTTFGQVSDTVSDHASFAGSGSSQYQNRAADCFHSLSLLRIQRVQIQHRARSVMNWTRNSKAQNPNLEQFPNEKPPESMPEGAPVFASLAMRNTQGPCEESSGGMSEERMCGA